jgi:hypothetical protein
MEKREVNLKRRTVKGKYRDPLPGGMSGYFSKRLNRLKADGLRSNIKDRGLK